MSTALAHSPARLITTNSLVPCQQPTRPNFKTACDFRQQVMCKHPFLSDFHSLAEHLYAGLNEGDHAVRSYVPQPFLLRLRGQYYQPDCYVVYQDGTRKVVELKPRGEFAEDKRGPLVAFFDEHGMVFEVISNEMVFARRIEAQNWLEIVRILQMAQSLDTRQAEEDLLGWFYQHEHATLGDIVDAGDRARTYLSEIALFRLLHRGQLTARLTKQGLDYDTRFSSCS